MREALMVFTGKTRQQAGSTIATVPAEVVRGLALQPGQELVWRETAPGQYLVTAFDPLRVEALAAHEAIIEQYREVFAALAR